MGSGFRFVIEPNWWEDEAAADRVWRVVLGMLGPTCNELWLRFGNLGEVEHLLPPEQARRLEELVGPYWGQPDPIPANPQANSPLDGILSDLVTAFEGMGFVRGDQGPSGRYAPYSCAVVPVSQELIDLLVGLTPSEPGSTAHLLSRLADHWHLRRQGADLISTGDGMRLIVLRLPPEEADALRQALRKAGLDPELLKSST